MIQHSNNERGSAIIIAMVILVALTVLGTMVLDTVSVESDVAANEKSSQTSVQLAEAGIAYAMEQLSALPLDPDDGQTFVDNLWDPLTTAGRTVQSTDSDCGHLNCTSDTWFRYHAPGSLTLGAGTYRVYVGDDDIAESGTGGNGVIYVRSIGNSNGAERMLEVALSPE